MGVLVPRRPPLLLNRWYVGPGRGLAFYGSFMVCFVGALLALAWVVGSGSRFLNATWYRRTIRAAGGLLVVGARR